MWLDSHNQTLLQHVGATLVFDFTSSLITLTATSKNKHFKTYLKEDQHIFFFYVFVCNATTAFVYLSNVSGMFCLTDSFSLTFQCCSIFVGLTPTCSGYNLFWLKHIAGTTTIIAHEYLISKFKIINCNSTFMHLDKTSVVQPYTRFWSSLVLFI